MRQCLHLCPWPISIILFKGAGTFITNVFFNALWKYPFKRYRAHMNGTCVINPLQQSHLYTSLNFSSTLYQGPVIISLYFSKAIVAYRFWSTKRELIRITPSCLIQSIELRVSSKCLCINSFSLKQNYIPLSLVCYSQQNIQISPVKINS